MYKFNRVLEEKIEITVIMDSKIPENK